MRKPFERIFSSLFFLRAFRYLLIHGIDTVFSCFISLRIIKKASPQTDFGSIQKILLCQGAHLGDAVVATSILPLIKERFPHVKIGFLVGSWAKPVVEGHPLIDELYCVDHWLANRSSASLWNKVKQYLRQRSEVLKQLRSSRYDVAVDLQTFFPNSVLLLYQARIPVRVGFQKESAAQLLTHPKFWEDKPQKMVDYHLELLSCLGIFPSSKTPLHPVLPPLSQQALAALQLIPTQRYIIFHLEGAQRFKEWPIEKWGQLLVHFLAQGHTVVFTGQGERHRELFSQLPSSQGINLSDRLNLHELMAVIKNTSLLVTVDSSPAHIASAYQVPTLILFPGKTRLEHWWPHNPHAQGLTHPMPCSPCSKGNGCATMDCIRKISVEQVIKAAHLMETV